MNSTVCVESTAVGIGQTCMPMQERIGIATVSEVRPKPDMSWIAAILGTGLRIARLREKAWTGEGNPSKEGFPSPEPPTFPRLLTFLRKGSPIVFQKAEVSHTGGGKSRSRKRVKNNFHQKNKCVMMFFRQDPQTFPTLFTYRERGEQGFDNAESL